MDKIIGIGVILETLNKEFLFQERDKNTRLNPGQIAPFGGGLEDGESITECAIREMYEELTLTLDPRRLKSIGVFESHNRPGAHIYMFKVDGVDPNTLELKEGSNIVTLTKQKALEHSQVTDFTKQVLRTI